MKTKLLAPGILFLLVLTLIAPAWAQDDEKKKDRFVSDDVIVSAQSATLRAKADSKSTALAKLEEFTPVEITDKKGDYVKVKAGKKTGYVLAKSLNPHAYVSVSNDIANVRSGPDRSDRILFTVKEHYPFKVVDRDDTRVKVVDFEGDSGWVHKNLISTTNYVIARLDTINVRKGPATDFPRVFTAEKGVIFKVLEEKDGWLHVKHEDGSEGWCSAKIVWGYLDD